MDDSVRQRRPSWVQRLMLALHSASPDSDRVILFPWLFGWGERLKPLRKFLRTRKAITSGRQLYQLSNDDLDATDFYRPLKFKFYQSLLSIAPGLFVMNALPAIYALEPVPLAAGDTLFGNAQTERIFAKLFPSVTALTIPFVLLAYARIAGRASLRPQDRTRAQITQSARAYLYFDGAYGLVPQTLSTFAASISIFADTYPTFLARHFSHTAKMWMGIVFAGVLLYTLVRFIEYSLLDMPLALYRANGYGSDEPRRRYLVTALLICPFIGIVIGLAVALATIIVAHAASYIQGAIIGGSS